MKCISQDFLDQAIRIIQQQIQTIKDELLHLDRDILFHQVNSKSWSIADCIEHLARYNDYYNLAMREAIQLSNIKQRGTSTHYKPSFLGKFSVKVVAPNSGKTLKTQNFLNPHKVGSIRNNVISSYLEQQEEFLSIVKDAKSTHLNKTKIRIEVMKLMRINLGDTILFMYTHQARHLQQALGILKNIPSLANQVKIL